MSIFVKIVMYSFLFQKFYTVIFRKNDTLSQASFTTDLEEFGKYEIEQEAVMFQMVDEDFDNDDNPYLEFKFRMTTWIDGVYKRTYLPLIKCENERIPAF